MTMQTQEAAYSNQVSYHWDDATGDWVPVVGNVPVDLFRSFGRLTTSPIGSTTPQASRGLVNQLLPPGILFVAGASGPESNTFTTRQIINNATLLKGFTDTSFGVTAVANTIPAGALNLVGRTLRVRAFGTLGCTATPNLTVDFALGAAGANVVATTGALALATATSPAPWVFEATATVQTAGASGAIISEGLFTYSTTSSVVSLVWTVGNTVRGTALTPVDLTAAQLVTLNATFSASSASNRIIVNGMVIELLF